MDDPLVSIGAGILIALASFLLGRASTWLDRDYASKQAARNHTTTAEMARLEETRRVYMGQIDARLRYLSSVNEVVKYPLLIEHPDANLALLGDAQLLSEFDEFQTSTRHQPRGVGVRNTGLLERWAALRQRIDDAAETQLAALRRGEEPTRLDADLVRERAVADRAGELRARSGG